MASTEIGCITDFSQARFLALAKKIEVQQKWPRPLDPDHFFPLVQNGINSGNLKVWGCDEALLAGLFVRNLYAGTPDAIVMFWWSLDGSKSNALWSKFEDEARLRKVVRVATSSFGEVRREALDRLYRMKGFSKSECVYTKFYG